MKISLNPKPHLEKQRPPLVWALLCQQCSMGNEKWVGVWPDDLSTTRLGPSRTPSTSSLHSAPAQSIALIFTYTEGSCKTCVNWGRWKGNCIADGCCVSWTLNSLLTFWACYQFLHDNFVRERTWAYGLLEYIIFNLMVNMVDGVWKAHLCIQIMQYFVSFLPNGLHIRIQLKHSAACFEKYFVSNVFLSASKEWLCAFLLLSIS